MKHSEMVLPVEVVLRDLAGWAEHPSAREPYYLWIDGINSALKERDDKNEKLREALEKIAVLYEKDIDADNYEQAANAYEMRCIARAVLENKHE